MLRTFTYFHLHKLTLYTQTGCWGSRGGPTASSWTCGSLWTSWHFCCSGSAPSHWFEQWVVSVDAGMSRDLFVKLLINSNSCWSGQCQEMDPIIAMIENQVRISRSFLGVFLQKRWAGHRKNTKHQNMRAMMLRWASSLCAGALCCRTSPGVETDLPLPCFYSMGLSHCLCLWLPLI